MKFDLADRIFQNAQNFKILCHWLDFPPMDELIKETRLWFATLGQEEDTISLRRKIWLLRSTAILALLPFDSEDLGFNQQILSIKREAAYIPYLEERQERLENLIQFLVENPDNPKRRKVFQLLQESWIQGIKVGLVYAVTRGSLPGWSEKLIRELQELAPGKELIEPISSPKVLRAGTYKQIIFPANGSLSPLLMDVYHGCRTQRLDVVAYKKEGIKVPQRLTLPKGTLIKIRPVRTLEELQQTTSDPVDEWAQRRFWESIRALEAKVDIPPSVKGDHEITVEARLVLLSNNKKVYLRDDLSVIEISDLVAGLESLEDYGKKLPRKIVNQLEVGDLIVLRTSGSGDYLYDVANSLLEADGKRRLRDEALDWKPVLKQAIKIHGTEAIFIRLKNRGHELKTNHRYIGLWTTDVVIGPKSESRFRNLISIIYELGYKVGNSDQVTAASTRWQKMKEIIRYHGKAGRKIRQDLLKELRRMIESGVIITDSYSLTIPDVSAGELSVFRVAGIDPEAVEIPYYQTGLIMDMQNKTVSQL